MKIQDLFNWTRKQVGKISQPFITYWDQRYQNLLGTNRKRKYLDDYRGWVFACVQARAEEVANIDFELYKGDTEIDESELLDLIDRVNPTMTKADLFFATQAFLDLEGNAFWFLARDKDGQGQIQEIWPLRPDLVQIVTDETNPLIVKGYIYTQPDQKKIPFEAKDILHFKNFNPAGNHPFPHRGVGIVQAASWAIDTDNEAQQWNFSFFRNSARPDGFLTMEGQGAISDEEYTRLKKQFSQEHQGSSNAYKIAILHGGLKWQEVTRSQKEMDFLEQRRFSRDEIMALFRVPKTAIGITEDVNRANAEASSYVFASRTIKPLMQKITDTMNEFLVPEFGDDLCLEFETPVAEDHIAEANYYSLALDKWMSRNEIREEEGLPPTANGDQFIGTYSQVPIDSVTEMPEPPEPIEPKAKMTGVNKVIEDFVARLPKTKEEPIRQLSALAKENYRQIWLRAFGVKTSPLEHELDEEFRRQKQEVLGNIDDQLKGLKAPEYKFKAISDLMFDTDKAVKMGIAILTPKIREYIEDAGHQAMLITGIGSAFDPTTPAIEKFIQSRARMFGNTMTETTATGLENELKIGLEANETTDQLSARVSAFYENQIDYRSERAARTEVSAGSNFGAEQAYKQAGVTKMQWFVVQPEDEDCQNNEGEVANIGEAFPSGDTMPPVHPNCVCTILPYFG
jgi:HK97 family phage portal protein